MKKGSESPVESWIPVLVEFPENHEEVKYSVTILFSLYVKKAEKVTRLLGFSWNPYFQ